MSDPTSGLSWVRAEFEACQRLTYLDVAGRAPMARRVHQELDHYLAVCRDEGARKDEWLRRVEHVRAQVADLLRADTDEIAFTKNTSDGLNTIGAALGLSPGDNVVICPEHEHANNVYPWLHLAAAGVEVRTVPLRAGLVDPADVAARVDGRTRLLSVSMVSAWTGARPDLVALGKLCREHDVFLLVDAAQALGIVDTDVHALGVDAVAAATQKGLLGMYGLGVLYCRAAWLPRLRPPFLSVAGVVRDGLHESDLASDAYRLRDSAARFETGNPNFAGLFALDGALSLLREAGTDAVERHVTELAGRLVDGLRDRGVTVATPESPGSRAGIVAFGVPDIDATHHRLDEQGIRVSVRRGLLRASLHAYNDDADVDHLVSAVTA